MRIADTHIFATTTIIRVLYYYTIVAFFIFGDPRPRTSLHNDTSQFIYILLEYFILQRVRTSMYIKYTNSDCIIK